MHQKKADPRAGLVNTRMKHGVPVQETTSLRWYDPGAPHFLQAAAHSGSKGQRISASLSQPRFLGLP